MKFTTILAKSLIKGGVLFALIAVTVGMYALSGGFDMAPPASHEQIMALRPPAEGSPAALAAEHDCWTGEAPADMEGVVPGHVVVSVKGKADGARYAGSRMVGIALDQMFAGKDGGIIVHAFCR